jgi:transcriptional regulator with XRE-family HTH domain
MSTPTFTSDADDSAVGEPWLGDAAATRIERVRSARGLGVEALAQRAGVHRGTIWSIEAHKHTPSVSTLYSIAVALGVAMEALLEQSWLA